MVRNGLVSSLVALAVLPTAPGTAASPREANWEGRAASTDGTVVLREVRALFDGTTHLDVTLGFGKPLPAGGRLGWRASNWPRRGRDGCGSSVDARIWLYGDLIQAFWQPGILTVAEGMESVELSDDRKLLRTTISHDFTRHDFRCITVHHDYGESLLAGPIAFDLPLEELRVKRLRRLGPDRGRLGRAVLRVAATDGARVRVIVRRRGKIVERRRFTAAEDSPRSESFGWLCRRPGVHRYTVIARDAYGAKLVERGRWTVRAKRRCR